MSPGNAREALRLDHEGSARPDLDRIHLSWLLRAYLAESPAVRGAISAHAPPPVGALIQRGLGRDLPVPDREPDPGPRRAADPEAVSWALTLWTERLVGDVPDRDGDPPVIV